MDDGEDAEGPYEEFTQSDDSQDIRNFERKVKSMIMADQHKKYEVRCDKSLMKLSFLKGCELSGKNALKNLQRKFNFDDSLIEPFHDETLLQNSHDAKYVLRIMNKEKELKKTMKRKALAASYRAQQRA